MPRFDLRCLACGWRAENVVLPGGEHPPCPQCQTITEYHWTKMASANVIGDECDITQENGFHTPQRFTSKHALDNALAQQGKEIRVRHMPLPGSDKSPHTTDWSKGSIDPYTLWAAGELVKRQAQSKHQGEDAGIEPLPVEWSIKTGTVHKDEAGQIHFTKSE